MDWRAFIEEGSLELDLECEQKENSEQQKTIEKGINATYSIGEKKINLETKFDSELLRE